MLQHSTIVLQRAITASLEAVKVKLTAENRQLQADTPLLAVAGPMTVGPLVPDQATNAPAAPLLR